MRRQDERTARCGDRTRAAADRSQVADPVETTTRAHAAASYSVGVSVIVDPFGAVVPGLGLVARTL